MGASKPRPTTGANTLHFLLSLFLLLSLLLPYVTGQPTGGAAADDDGTGASPTTEEELASKLAPYAPAIGGVIAGLGVILGGWLFLEQVADVII